ncbi:helix-turn-helix domain-containing protein [Avibacterium paragallinarum]|uniref:helix-turn-helix domain-containing protein n=1 Tax=Avibacterium paragallinarum TaxID=728 RepID=UPI00021ACFD7|nr:helix-turn-helix transcriptional regulator [Avibacterium paragallinarum]AZI14123.1 XRE family transcriptional regulator [Avibacterium paragallinarum]QIR11592.1 helix-turn-helix transcriptional regulator [Avibacterium paragallinarum]QJE09434.1 helix-turn-helix transcriptional regulator [Avibacterium paragallinarum]QJE11630.1 helix-turn-helix transcriptional regulator [Avibacterium paragallinarum]QJE13829.1 helix-turn-helix transcriptional regulator [Avibacterium paragallinarum]
MNINEKIRKLREAKDWSQEQMADRMHMSLNGYAKIERGETKLYLDKLEQIAQVLDIDFVELISSGEKNVFLQINENSHLGSSFQGNNETSLMIEIEKLKLSLAHSQQLLEEKETLLQKLLEQKDSEIKALKEMIEILKGKA